MSKRVTDTDHGLLSYVYYTMNLTAWIIRTDLPNEVNGEDPLKKLYDEKSHEKMYAVFNEVSDTGKEHQHALVYTTTNKKDTVNKWITNAIPSLKRHQTDSSGAGGTTKYSVHAYLKENDIGYHEYQQDYVCKDGMHRCGELWNNLNSNNYHSSSHDNPLPNALEYPEYAARADRRQAYLALNPPVSKNQKTKIKKRADLEKYLLKEIEQNPLHFYLPVEKDSLKRVNHDKLIEYIYLYYVEYGKPRNRNFLKVIAEDVLFYSPIVCKEDKQTKKDIKNSVTQEINKMLY